MTNDFKESMVGLGTAVCLIVLMSILVIAIVRSRKQGSGNDNVEMETKQAQLDPLYDTVRYVDFDGHQYVKYSRGQAVSLCHSPKCPCLNGGKEQP